MEQFEVLKHISLAMARTLERELEASCGRAIPVVHYVDGARPDEECVSLVHAGLQRRPESTEREYEVERGVEQFRAPPLLLRAHYLVSAWSRPPEDQALLGAVLRTFLDRPGLELEGPEEDIVAYAGIPGIGLDTLSAEDHRLLASSIGLPFAPSIGYWVDFNLRSAKTTPIKRVRERVVDFRKIEG